MSFQYWWYQLCQLHCTQRYLYITEGFVYFTAVNSTMDMYFLHFPLILKLLILPSLPANLFLEIYSHYTELLNLYCDERRDTPWNIAWALGESRGQSLKDFPMLRLYFIVYPDANHNTNIANYISSIVLPGYQYWKSWFSILLRQLGKYCLVDWEILES